VRRVAVLVLWVLITALFVPTASGELAEGRPPTASRDPGHHLGLATLEQAAPAGVADVRPVGSPFVPTNAPFVRRALPEWLAAAATGLRPQRYVRDARAFIRRACWRFKAPAAVDDDSPRMG